MQVCKCISLASRFAGRFRVNSRKHAPRTPFTPNSRDYQAVSRLEVPTQARGRRAMARRPLYGTRRKVKHEQKMMLLALAVVSAAAFALPASASAAENHLTNVTTFSGSGRRNPHGTRRACDHMWRCHECQPCHRHREPRQHNRNPRALDNTIKSSGTFHLVKINSSPGILVTPVHTMVIFANISNTTVQAISSAQLLVRNVVPPRTSMTISVDVSGATQNHKSCTGVNYNLTSQTGTAARSRMLGCPRRPRRPRRLRTPSTAHRS